MPSPPRGAISEFNPSRASAQGQGEGLLKLAAAKELGHFLIELIHRLLAGFRHDSIPRWGCSITHFTIGEEPLTLNSKMTKCENGRGPAGMPIFFPARPDQFRPRPTILIERNDK